MYNSIHYMPLALQKSAGGFARRVISRVAIDGAPFITQGRETLVHRIFYCRTPACLAWWRIGSTNHGNTRMAYTASYCRLYHKTDIKIQ